ncbi:MAG TPA: alpha/beta fold hydrolase [Mycobacteriales bacterium]|jgi:pimeloyl-ACP methyl ester carboxylesterase|nr:alpha/beta fold hydrolase [Mycobacteriales bacterium]
MTRTAVPLGDVPIRRVTIPGARLALADVGDARAIPVVMVPGYTGSKEDFGPLLAPLAEAGFRAIAYDQRGQHESTGAGGAYTPEALAADLLALLQTLALPPAHLVGHSFGGLVARAAVLRAPDRFESLVLMDSGPAALPGARAHGMRRLRPVLLEHGLEAVWAALEPTTSSSDFGRRRFLAQHPPAVVAMGDALLAEPDRTEELRTVAAAHALPILVLTGERDDAWSPRQQRAMARRLRARYVEIAGAVHSPAVEEPAATLAALCSFYASLGLPERGVLG